MATKGTERTDAQVWDLLLSDKESSPTTEQGLIIAENQEGFPDGLAIRELSLPPVPPRQSEGPFDFSHLDPATSLVFQQDDWSGGGFGTIWDPTQPNKYCRCSGIDLRFKNIAIPGMRLDNGHGETPTPVVSVGFLLHDPSFEHATLGTAWSDVSSPTSTDSVTTDPRSEDNSARHARVDSAGAGDGISQNLTNPTVYQSRGITFYAYVKVVTGSNGIYIVVADNVGSSDTSGAAVTATTYTLVSQTRTIDNAAVSVTVSILANGADCTFDVDDCALTFGVTIADTGFLFPGTVTADGTTINCDNWANINNVKADDGALTDCSPSSTTSNVTTQYLNMTGFGATVPAGATITGIEAENERGNNTPTGANVFIGDETIQLIVGGIRLGDNKALTAIAWPDALTVKTYGGNSDDWSASPTRENVVAPDFGISLRGKAYFGNVTTADSWDIDYVKIKIHYVTEANAPVCIATAVDGDDLYGIFGLAICKLDAKNGTNGPVWDAVYIDNATSFTDLTEFDGNLFAGLGTAEGYVYGSGTSWTVSTLTGTAKNAIKFAKSRTSLWKTETDNTIKSATNPLNGGSWSSGYTIGSSDRKINNIYGIRDTIVVGKEDGIHWYRRVYDDGASADLFENQTDEFDNFQSVLNFAKGTSHLGWLYLNTSLQGLYRTNTFDLQNLTSIISNPAIAEATAQVQGLINGPDDLYLGIHNGKSGSAGIATLTSVRETTEGFKTHPLHEVSLSQINHMAVHFTDRGTDGTRPMLYMMGLTGAGVTGTQHTYAWMLPADSQSPVQSSDPKTNLFNVEYDTCLYHGGLPQEAKALIAAHLWSTGHSNENVTMTHGWDGADPTTTMFTFSGSTEFETKYLEDISDPVTNATGNIFQARIQMLANGTSHLRRIRAVVFEFTLRSARVPAWHLIFHVGGATLRNGAAQDEGSENKETMKTRLNTLEAQGFPMMMTEDFDGDGTASVTRVIMRPGTLRKRYDLMGEPNSPEYWEVVLQKTRSST